MKVLEFPKCCRDLYAAQSAFVRLGFDVNETYWGFCKDKSFVMQLQTQGKTFTILASKSRLHTYETARAMWIDFAAAVMVATERELDQCWHEWDGSNHLVELVASLHRHGFLIPNVPSTFASVAASCVDAARNESNEQN
jgi:hypothetical protein